MPASIDSRKRGQAEKRDNVDNDEQRDPNVVEVRSVRSGRRIVPPRQYNFDSNDEEDEDYGKKKSAKMSLNRVTKRKVLAARNNITVNEERKDKVVTAECRETVLATPRRNLRRNEKRKTTQEKNLSNIRRSSRKRKLKYENYSDSWIVGAQALIGYPMYGNSYSMKERKNNYDGDEEEETFDEEEEELEENRNEEEGNEVVSDKQAEEVNGQVDDEQGTGEDCAENSEKPVENGEVEEPSKEEGSRSQRLRRACRDKITPNTTNGRPRRGRNEAANSNAKTRKQKRKRRGNGNTSSSESNYEAPVAANSGGTYCLRKTRGQVDRFNVAGPLSSRRRRHRSVTESDSSDSEDEAIDKARRSKRKSILHNAGTDKFGRLGDLDPVSLDTDIKFTEVGGLEEHVRCLKEMVIFPMKYSQVFSKFHISLPKGVLFHGPPGTGKTLIARALANECSSGAQKVSFFMRKGADVMSKWVGESERQLRLLFEQARQSRPSIIFFDEIDGLAPVRSTKQDQVHASIVSTLLALMDGLDNRGDIIVIGATNRIDAIDPALRRPGRFDRELLFPLPSSQQRGEILKIHTGKWESQPSEADILKMAELSNGYCGADLRGLCAEAVMAALRRRYPQIYKTNDTLLINPDNVKVEWGDFAEASKKLVPSTHRSTPAVAQRLPLFLEPLFKHTLSELNAHLRAAFPSGYCKQQQNACKQMVKAPRLLIIGENKQTTILASALLCNMESCPVHVFDMSTLYTRGASTPEEACVMIFNEARRTVPSVIYMPCVDNWWDTLTPTLQALITSTLNTIDPCLPILLMATTQTTLTTQLRHIFSSYRKEIYRVPNPTDAQRKQFFQPLIVARSLRPTPKNNSVEEELEELPRAPTPPPPKRTAEELRAIVRQEDSLLRNLRCALRIICEKIAREKTFFLFVKPVDERIVTDYRKHVHEPMYIEKVMLKINKHEYSCLSDFVEDMKLIVDNALRYNPDKTEEGQAIRHRACMLHDKYHHLITEHVSLELEMACKKVVKDRLLREKYPDHLPHDFDLEKAVQPIPGATLLEEDSNSTLPLTENEEPVNKSLNETANSVLNSSTTSRPSQRKRRRTPAWQHGRIKKQTNKNNSQRHELNVNEKSKTDSNSIGKAESPSSASKSGSDTKQSKVVLARLPSPIRHSTPVRRRKRAAEPEVAVPSTSYAAMNGDVHSDEEMEIDGEPVTKTKQTTNQDAKDDEDLWLDHSFNIATVDSLENIDETGACNKVVINRQALEQVLQEVVRVTRRVTSLELILDLYATLRSIINRHLGTNQRQGLPAELEMEIRRFAIETEESGDRCDTYSPPFRPSSSNGSAVAASNPRNTRKNPSSSFSSS